MSQDDLLALIDQAAEKGWTELDLSGQGLTALPPEIGKLTQLEKLILGKVVEWEYPEGRPTPKLITNALSALPAEIAALESLKVLELSGNPLEQIPEIVFEFKSLSEFYAISINLPEIPDCIGQLSNLTSLGLGNNQISQISDSIGQLKKLASLGLSSNRISQIPDSIGQLSNLTHLGLSSNRISQIPDSIGQLKRLAEIAFANNRISQIPDSIGQLSNLTHLWLGNNQISQIPDSIGQLKKLTQLGLPSNQISEIPNSIGQLSNLTHLGLDGNQIIQIPNCIGQLTNLTQLWLGNNQISQIPNCLSQLTNLTLLILNSNQITQIPNCIGHLTNLTQLGISSNQICQIPESIGHLTNLTQLWISRNQITEIPECFNKMTNLTQLALSSNQITEIPECLGKMTNLTELWFYSNQITEIPECIGKITNLTQLILSSNQISVIPDCIGQLTQLEKLDLDNNQIEKCPECLKQLPHLKTLDLRRNPLPISPEILGPKDTNQDPGSIAEIFNYLRQLHSGEVRPLNEAKLLLVGQGSVGKTSLIQRLIDNQFNPNQPQTDGLSVRDWQIHVNTKDVRLNVWDFGGQEIYHATHQFFLTKRSLYLLVGNCRTSEEENRLEYWLKLIQSFGGESPVIIVGNKCDEQPLDINQKALRDKYPNIKAILETSCQTGEGVEQLRTAILQEAAQLREVYNLLPLSWFQVKEQLEILDRDFITYNEYIGICHQNAIPDEKNQEQLIDLLHNLGLVLNFREHPLLHNTNVLNPAWVTEGIYALLSDDDLKVKTKGQLTLADMSRILSADRYPPDRHHYLRELMKEFQLCFELPNCQPIRHLIPGILPKEEPDSTDLSGDILEFQYHYPVLPSSIISRFIVLTHEKIYQQTYWRSGVMLAYTEGDAVYNTARIKADPADHKIFIAVGGQESTRRLFLGIIRDVFNKIHANFTQPTEWVPIPEHPEHPPLDYQELLGLETMGVNDYPIGKLRIKVNLRQLLDGYEPIETRRRRQHPELDELESDYGFPRDRFQIVNQIINTNQQQQTQKREDKSMTDITNNLQGANIGNLVNEAKDNAQVTASHFTQTSGANTAELLQIIANLRQITAQFPPDVREDITIDLDDVEAEINKPDDQRSQARLKKRLLALLAATSVLAGSVAQVTDFVNNITDLGSKVGIELQLPSSP
ncbi:MAG: COR domain-containing protein [Leptolyngbyaceae cyanobacterium MO_188.B28]|nr:COR domain-containing protein [Leptolyngbyaceae cyanobacterium MO_188.B28]